MVHKTSRKPRPTPLKSVQIAVQADEARRYLVLGDAHSSLPSLAYPFEQVAPSTPLSPPPHGNHLAWQVRARASNDPPTCTPPRIASHLLDSLSSIPPLVQVEPGVVLSSSAPNHRWDDNCINPVPLYTKRAYRSLTPPISPPALPPPGTDTEHSSKRSGMTFALVPAEVGGKHVFTHVVVNCGGNNSKDSSGPPSIPSGEDGLPEDMQDILQQLDDLASWVKAASSSRDCISNVESIVHTTCPTGHPGTDAGGDNTSHPNGEPFPSKGKARSLSATTPNSVYDTRQDVELSRSAVPGNPTNISPDISCQSEGFIYVPTCNTPEFLAGSSNSPVAYPVCGYSSHPLRHSPLPPGPTHEIPYPRRFLERRSAPCSPPARAIVSPPPGKTSFRTLFQRSSCNTNAVCRPSIPSGHVPVEGALRQGKRMRVPWLKI